MSVTPDFDTRRRMGRFGFEVQYALLVRPKYLEFDPSAKKLGTLFDPEKLPPLPKMPEGYHWVGDPSSKKAYMKRHEVPPKRGRRSTFFLTDHHQKYAGAIGYEAYWVYNELDHVCFQLELVSDPFDDRYTEEQYNRDLRWIYGRVMPAMLETGVIGAYSPGRPQHIKEQISLEIDDVRWPRRIDPLLKLARLGAGMWAITRWGHLAEIASPYDRALLAFNRRDLQSNTRELLRFDLFSNLQLLFEAWFADVHPRLTFRWLQKLLLSRAHTAILATCFNNDICYWYVHALVDLSYEDLQQVTLADFELFRSVGIDSMFLDIFAGLPQPHLYMPYRARRWEMLRSSLKHFVDAEAIEDLIKAAILGGTPAVRKTGFPLNHPRKTISPGCVYIECRHAARVRMNKADRKRWRNAHYPIGKDRQLVGYIDHLHVLAQDWLKLFDVALMVGEELLDLVRRGDPRIVRKDEEGLRDALLPVMEAAWAEDRPPFHR